MPVIFDMIMQHYPGVLRLYPGNYVNYFEEYATLSWKEYNIILKSKQHYPKKNATLFSRVCNMFLKIL